MLWHAALGLLCLDAAFALLIALAAHPPVRPVEIRVSVRGGAPASVIAVAPTPPNAPALTPPKEIVVAIGNVDRDAVLPPAAPPAARYAVTMPIREAAPSPAHVETLTDDALAPPPRDAMLADHLVAGGASTGPADEVVGHRRPPAPVADRLGVASLSLALLRDAPDTWRRVVDRLAPARVGAPLDEPVNRVAAAPAPDRLIVSMPVRADAPPARRAVARADRLVPSALARGVRVAALSDETAWSALARPWSSEPQRPELLPTARPSPAVLLAHWLPELSSSATTADLKTQFVRHLLPLVMQVNEEILQRRARVIALAPQIAAGETLSEGDARFVADVLQETRLDAWDADELLQRLDAVPLSMALAQAAQESGWGRSRPAREDNALFGQMMFAPATRPQVQPFPDLLETVTAYARNLNSHWAYREFRRRRAALRARGDALDGHALVPFIERYSERGLGYVEAIRQLMRMNNLFALDVRVLDAALGGPALEGPVLEGPAVEGGALDPDRIVADPIGAIGPVPRPPAQGMDN